MSPDFVFKSSPNICHTIEQPPERLVVAPLHQYVSRHTMCVCAWKTCARTRCVTVVSSPRMWFFFRLTVPIAGACVCVCDGAAIASLWLVQWIIGNSICATNCMNINTITNICYYRYYLECVWQTTLLLSILIVSDPNHQAKLLDNNCNGMHDLQSK